MSQIIKYNIFTQLCMICGDFQCEYESYHKKWSLKQVQQLLSQHLQVEVSIEKIKNSQKTNEFNFNYIFENRNHVKISANSIKNIKTIQQGYGIQKCVQRIQQCLCSNDQTNNENSVNSPDSILQSTHLSSILGSIYCMQILSSRPLVYHDIHQLIILIGMYKWESQEQQNTNNKIGIDFPFTRERVTKAIKYIQESIKKKHKILLKIMRNKEIIENKQNCQPNLKSIMNNYNTISKNHLNYSNKTNKSSHSQSALLLQTSNPLSSSFFPSQLLSKSLIQSNTFANIIGCIKQINTRCYSLSTQQMQRHLFCVIFNEITKLQCKVLQAVKKYKNIQKNHKIISQKSNQILNYMNLQQQLRNNNKQSNINSQLNNYNQLNQHKSVLPQKQQQQIIQFVSIQGIPFPSNRRCIDFSLFHIDDALLLSYLPALQKFKDLQQLCLRDNKLTLLGYKFIKNTFPNLRSLDLRQNHLDKQKIEIICGFKQLNILYISDCEINSASLIKICLNMDNVNFLYCDNLKIIQKFPSSQSQEQNEQQKQNHQNHLDYRSMFYIMCLNMKKLLYFSIKGYFCTNVKNMVRSDCEIMKPMKGNNGEIIVLSDKENKQIKIVKSITDILKKRHGILEI